MNTLQNLISQTGSTQPWWYVRAQLLILLTTLALFAAGMWAAVPIVVRAL